jgi:hypothetical protein
MYKMRCRFGNDVGRTQRVLPLDLFLPHHPSPWKRSCKERRDKRFMMRDRGIIEAVTACMSPPGALLPLSIPRPELRRQRSTLHGCMPRLTSASSSLCTYGVKTSTSVTVRACEYRASIHHKRRSMLGSRAPREPESRASRRHQRLRRPREAFMMIICKG